MPQEKEKGSLHHHRPNKTATQVDRRRQGIHSKPYVPQRTRRAATPAAPSERIHFQRVPQAQSAGASSTRHLRDTNPATLLFGARGIHEERGLTSRHLAEGGAGEGAARPRRATSLLELLGSCGHPPCTLSLCPPGMEAAGSGVRSHSPAQAESPWPGRSLEGPTTLSLPSDLGPPAEGGPGPTQKAAPSWTSVTSSFLVALPCSRTRAPSRQRAT